MAEALRPWPSAPPAWSFSTLRVVRECPRRWALRRLALEAAAPAEARSGGGASPSWAALRGIVSHAALEELLRIHQRHGGPPAGSWALLDFWKRHVPEGIPALVTRKLEAEFASRRAEPLSRRQLDELRATALDEINRLTTFVNAKLRVALELGGGGAAAPQERTSRAALLEGAHPEVELIAELEGAGQTLRWSGKADVIVVRGSEVTIVDYKTGAESEHDREQLELYALLFSRDEVINPGRLRAVRLVLVYWSGRVERWDGPGPERLDELEGRLFQEVCLGASALEARPPLAKLHEARCPRCDMRAWCDDYWAGGRARTSAPASRGPGDLELTVVRVHAGGAEIHGKERGPASNEVLLLIDDDHRAFASTLRPTDVVRVAGAWWLPQPDYDDAGAGPAPRVAQVTARSALALVGSP